MTDVAQDHQLDTTTPTQQQSPELRRFEAIKISIPVHLRPCEVAEPLTNLSTEENGRLDRIYRETEAGKPPSERLADGYFADEFMKILGHRDVEFRQEAFVRLSDDKKYGFIVGPTGFSAGRSDDERPKTRLLCVKSPSKLGRRAYGYYRRADAELEPLGLTEKQGQRLPEDFLNQYHGREIPCVGIIFDHFTEGERTAVLRATCTRPQQADATHLASFKSLTLQKAKVIRGVASDTGEVGVPGIQYTSDNSSTGNARTGARQDAQKSYTLPDSPGDSSSTSPEPSAAQSSSIDRKGKGRAAELDHAANAVPRQPLGAEDVYGRAQQLVHDEELAWRIAAAEGPLSQKQLNSLIGLEQASGQQDLGATVQEARNISSNRQSDTSTSENSQSAGREGAISSRSFYLRSGDQAVPGDAGCRDTNNRRQDCCANNAPTLSDAVAGPNTPAARAKRPRTSPPSGDSQKPAAKISRLESDDDGSPHPRHLGRRDRQLDSRSNSLVNGGRPSQISPPVDARPPSTSVPSKHTPTSQETEAQESLQDTVLSGAPDSTVGQGKSHRGGMVDPVGSSATANGRDLPNGNLDLHPIIPQGRVGEVPANVPHPITTARQPANPRNSAHEGHPLFSASTSIPWSLTASDWNRLASMLLGVAQPAQGPTAPPPAPVVDGVPILRGLRAALMLVDCHILSGHGIELYSPSNGDQSDENLNNNPPLTTAPAPGNSSADSNLFDLLRAARGLMAVIAPEVLSTIGIRITVPQARLSTGSGVNEHGARGSGEQASTKGHHQPASSSDSPSNVESGGGQHGPSLLATPAVRQSTGTVPSRLKNGGRNRTANKSAPMPVTPSHCQPQPRQARENPESPSGAMDWAPFAQEESTAERPDSGVHLDPHSPTAPARRIRKTKAVNSVPHPASNPSFAPDPLGRNFAAASETRGLRREAVDDLMDIEMVEKTEEKSTGEPGEGEEIEDASLSNNPSGEALPPSRRRAEQLRRPRSVQDGRKETATQTIRAVRSQPRMHEVNAKQSNLKSAKDQASSSTDCSQEPGNSHNARVLTTPGAGPSQVVTNQAVHVPGSENVEVPNVAERAPATDGQAITATETATTAPLGISRPPGQEVGGLAHSIRHLNLTRTRGSSPMDTVSNITGEDCDYADFYYPDAQSGEGY